jgi:hypothetical protein
MGFMKTSKINIADSGAQRAAYEGHSIFFYRFDLPTFRSGWSGTIPAGAETIEAIEAAGWTLAQSVFEPSRTGTGAVILIFRRIAAPHHV